MSKTKRRSNINKRRFSDQQFNIELTNKMNIQRVKHGVQPLVLDAGLSKISQAYAEKLAKLDTMKHSGNKWQGNSLGENLAMAYPKMTADMAANMWYNEIKNYNWASPAFQGNTGHFTQVVWKGSKQVGVGIAKSKKNNWYVVANYYPAGNNYNQFRANVLPVKK